MEKTSTKSTAAWNDNTIYALGLYRFITKCLGIWPPTCHNFIPKCQVFIVCILQITMMTSMIAETHFNCAAVNDKIVTISLTACCVITVVKVLVIKANNAKMFEIILSAVEDWSSTVTLYDNPRMKKCAQLGRFICLFQMISSYTNSLPMCLSGFIVSSSNSKNVTNFTNPVLRNLPLNTICFYGEMSTGWYIAVYILQVIQLFTTIMGNVGTDCYFFGITMHLSGQMEQLIVDMEQFGSKKTNTRYRNNLTALIKRQIHLLKLADFLESTFTFITLLQVSTITYEICLVSLQMIIGFRQGNSAVIIGDLIWLYILYLQLFLYSYAGDRLSTATENLGTAIYKSQWFDLSTEVSKDLIFIIMRCGKPFALTAGKICNMNLESFKNIVKAVASYFSVLLAMFDD